MKVLLFHALARTPSSLVTLARALEARGHTTHRVRFATTHRRLDDIAAEAGRDVDRFLARPSEAAALGYVAHSLGGLVVRALAGLRPDLGFARGVLLGSPIRGTMIADRCRHWTVMRLLYGRVLDDMTTEAAARLPPPPGVFATIAGTRWTPWLPAAHITRRLAPGEPSDSTVLVRETRHPDEAGHLEVDASHHGLVTNAQVLAAVAAFLEQGTPPRR